MLLYGGATFGLATITIIEYRTGSQRLVPLDSIPAALGIATLAFGVFGIGYKIGPAWIARYPTRAAIELIHRRFGSGSFSVSRSIGTYAVGLVALALIAALEGSFGYLGNATTTSASQVSWYSQPLQALSELRGLAILALSYIQFTRPSRLSGQALVLFVLIDLSLGMVSGLKEGPLTTILMAVIGYIVARRRIPWIALMAVIVGFILFLAPFVSGFRGDVRSHERTLPLAEAVSVGVHRLTSGESAMDTGPVESLTRFRQIENLAVIVDQTPSRIAYRSPLEVVSAPVSGMIPRAVWPTKPIRLSGLEFYQTYYGGTANSSSALTIPGSIYMYGGGVAIVLGMFLLGASIRGLDDAIEAPTNLHGTIILAVVFPTLIKQEIDVSSLLASIPVYAALSLAGILLLSSQCPGVRSQDARRL